MLWVVALVTNGFKTQVLQSGIKEFLRHGFGDPPTRYGLPGSRCRPAGLARFGLQGADYQRKWPARRIGQQRLGRRWN